MKTLKDFVNESFINESVKIKDFIDIIKQQLIKYKNETDQSYRAREEIYEFLNNDKTLSDVLSPISKSKRSGVEWRDLNVSKNDTIEIMYGAYPCDSYSPYNFIFKIEYFDKKDELIIAMDEPEWIEWQEKFIKKVKIDKFKEFLEFVEKNAKSVEEVPGNKGRREFKF